MGVFTDDLKPDFVCTANFKSVFWERNLRMEPNFNIGDLEMLFSDDNPTLWDDIPDDLIVQALQNAEIVIVDEKKDDEGTDGDVAIRATPTPEPAAAAPADVEAPVSAFKKLSEADLIKIESGKDEKTTKSATAWGVKRLKGKN